jgi:N-acetylglucosaminyldiphosphoundecaprenol N-acetyl-beta-D-mannosaminyltransferase
MSICKNESMTSRKRVRFTSDSTRTLSVLGKTLFTSNKNIFWAEILRLLGTNNPHLLITLNVDQTIRLTKDELFRNVFNSASLITLDGMPLVKFARMLRLDTVTRITGADMLIEACSFSIEHKLQICLVGGSEEVAARAREQLLKIYKELDISIVDFPFIAISDLGNPLILEVVQNINQKKPNLVFISLGSPKQEAFFHHYREKLPPAIYIGSGASLDFIGGWKRRAPKLLQDMSLEWTWRLAQEPKRLAKRYLITSWRIIPILIMSIIDELRNG